MGYRPVCALRVLMPALAVLVAASGCVVTSFNPITPLEKSEPIPEFLIGNWDVVEALGERPGEAVEVTMGRNADGSLRYFMKGESVSHQRDASLATAGDMTVLSFLGEDVQLWAFGSISFDAAAQELTISFPIQQDVVDDISAGIVKGEIVRMEDEDHARLTASGEELRTYFATHADVFGDRDLVLRKRAP